MPIYAYRCEACGHAQDALQKLSDPPLTVCPSCGAPAFKKQLTAAGFQLKGSGWYATDFKNKGSGAGAAGATPAATPDKADAAPKTETGSGDTESSSSDSSKKDVSASGSGSCNPGCACH